MLENVYQAYPGLSSGSKVGLQKSGKTGKAHPLKASKSHARQSISAANVIQLKVCLTQTMAIVRFGSFLNYTNKQEI